MIFIYMVGNSLVLVSYREATSGINNLAILFFLIVSSIPCFYNCWSLNLGGRDLLLYFSCR
jgi:hypothetical protein